MRHARLVWGWFALIVLGPHGMVRGQAIDEQVRPPVVIGPDSPFAQQLLSRLRAGGNDTTQTFSVTADAPRCTPTLDGVVDEVTSAVVRVQLSDADHVRVCAWPHGAIAPRELGPLSPIDGAAVEQVAMVVEGFVRALTTTSTAPAEPAEPAEPATAEPEPAQATMTDASTETEPAATTDVTVTATDDVTVHEEPVTDRHHHHRYALRASYEPTLWQAETVAHNVRLAAQTRLSDVLWIGLALHYMPTITRDNDVLGARLSALGIDAVLGASLGARGSLALDGELALRSEVLWIDPFVPDGSTALAGDARSAIGVQLRMSAGPRVKLMHRLWLGAQLGALVALNPRRYGFERSGGRQSVVDESRPRPGLWLSVWFEL